MATFNTGHEQIVFSDSSVCSAFTCSWVSVSVYVFSYGSGGGPLPRIEKKNIIKQQCHKYGGIQVSYG